jgi:hypothetical protein
MTHEEAEEKECQRGIDKKDEAPKIKWRRVMNIFLK